MWKATKDARIKKRGEVYWARFMKRGQHVQESLETRSFEIAKRLVEAIESDILLGVNWKKERETFETAWTEFLSDKAKGVKTTPARTRTLREYIQFGDRFYLPAFKDLRLSQIDEQAWGELVDKVRKERPGILFDNMRKYLMGFLSWSYRKGKIRLKPELFDPDRAKREERLKDGPGKAYTIEELSEMRVAAMMTGSDSFYLFVLMAQYMGMRPSEITQLKLDRIDLTENVIRLRRSDTKTKQGRVVPIHPMVMFWLQRQIKAAEGSSFLFPNRVDHKRPMDPTGFKKPWAAVLERCPAICGRIYDFRHTFITNAIKAGMNPAAVGLMTGTSLKMIEQRYLHLTASELNDELGKLEL